MSFNASVRRVGARKAAFPINWDAARDHGVPSRLVFTGPANRYMQDANGTFQSYASNVPRVGYVYSGGVFVRAWLLESGRTNSALGSNLFADETYWLGSGDFTVAGVTSCIAGQTAWSHTNKGLLALRARSQDIGTFVSGQTDCASWIVGRPASNAADTTIIGIYDVTVGAFVAQATITWATLNISIDAGSGTCGLITIGPGRYLIYITATGTASGTGAAGHSRRICLYPSGNTVNTQALTVHHGQLETATTYPSSPIITTTAAVSRSAETAYLPFPMPPQAMSAYAKFVEAGTIAQASARVFQLSDGSNDNPRFVLSQSAGQYSASLWNGASSISSTASASPILGDSVELHATLTAGGTLRLGQALNGGAEVLGSAPAALALPAGWSAPPLLILNASNTSAGNDGGIALQRLVLGRGFLSMADLRAA